MRRSISMLRGKKGFTLIELIVVLAVLAIIMAIAVPRFLGVQETAKIDADYATGAMLAKAAELYVAQNEDAATIEKSELQLSNLSFKSSKLVDQTIEDVTFTLTPETGEIKVQVADNTTEATLHQLYPIPEPETLD